MNNSLCDGGSVDEIINASSRQ